MDLHVPDAARLFLVLLSFHSIGLELGGGTRPNIQKTLDYRIFVQGFFKQKAYAIQILMMMMEKIRMITIINISYSLLNICEQIRDDIVLCQGRAHSSLLSNGEANSLMVHLKICSIESY